LGGSEMPWCISKRQSERRMSSSRMWRHVALVRIDVSGERITSIIRVTTIGELGITSAVTSHRTANVIPSFLIRVILMMEAIRSSDTSVLTRAAWRHISEVDNPHSHHRENLKSYTKILYLTSTGTPTVHSPGLQPIDIPTVLLGLDYVCIFAQNQPLS
jgi:hypothetical protein